MYFWCFTHYFSSVFLFFVVVGTIFHMSKKEHWGNHTYDPKIKRTLQRFRNRARMVDLVGNGIGLSGNNNGRNGNGGNNNGTQVVLNEVPPQRNQIMEEMRRICEIKRFM